MVALASLALQSAKKLFQKGNLENKRMILTLSGADIRAWSVGIDPYTFWGLDRFFPGHFLRPDLGIVRPPGHIRPSGYPWPARMK